MIETKLFTGYFEGEYGTIDRKYFDIDTEINEFLSKTDIEIIDIKYAVSVVNGESWNSALMIYKLK